MHDDRRCHQSDPRPGVHLRAEYGRCRRRHRHRDRRGSRRGELCALRWSDFRTSGNGFILTVSRSRSIVAGKGVVEGSTKNGHSRKIILSPALRSVLFSYRWRLTQEAARHGRKPSPYLFVNSDGSLIHPDTFTKRLRKIYAGGDDASRSDGHATAHRRTGAQPAVIPDGDGFGILQRMAAVGVICIGSFFGDKRMVGRGQRHIGFNEHIVPQRNGCYIQKYAVVVDETVPPT